MSTHARYFRNKLALALAAALTLPSGALFAQDQGSDESESEKDTKKSEETALQPIRVTGSLISRLGFDTISPLQVITADNSIAAGEFDTATILQTSNVAAGSTQISTQFGAYIVEGGTGVQTLSLRGLGANRTLVLLDGQRPGPAGTRGQVGAFDLNVIPSVILQRAEILKDGAGSIYGSDAVAGVVNLITRKSMDRPELIVDMNLPTESGGERYNISGAGGWNFDNGSVVAAFQRYHMNALKVGDRDFFKCNYDLVRDAAGNILPYEDRSFTRGTENEGCINFGIYNAIDDLGLPASGRRYGPVPGATGGPIPGYGIVRNGNANPGAGTPAYYEQPFYAPFANKGDVFAEQDRLSLYFSGDFTFGSIGWNGQLLYTERETKSRRFRQFFPQVDGRPYGFVGNPSANPNLTGNVQVIMPAKSNQDIDVDYWYASSNFNGGFGNDSSWSWRFNTSYSHSSGDYTVFAINRDITGDRVTTPDRDGGDMPINYFDPGILSGERMDDLMAAIGQRHTGNTVYTQFVANAMASGELFELPGGTAAAAIGSEFRRISIDDTPSAFELNRQAWGQSSARPTRGKDYISEIYGELELPVLAGLPGVEELTFNASARMFKYDTVEDSDKVWKIGGSWQIIPSLRLRATNGTSYRAPGLYELYLGDLSGFLGQAAIDPCINWGTNAIDPRVRANCAADGIPEDYDGVGSSAQIFTGGGLGVLKPETSKALTAGIVFTPEFANLSVSLDYFKIQVNDQIDSLGGAGIVGACYYADSFPNAFCSLFTRRPGNAATGAYNIESIRDAYVNVNKQLTRGYDLNLRWDREFSFGKLEVESQLTYTMEDVYLLFDTAEEGGFAIDDQNGIVTRPKLVGDLRTALNRGDWTYTWTMNYIDSTKNWYLDPIGSYRGNPDAVYDIKAGSRLYHAFSVRYATDKWSAVVGLTNLFDTDPPKMSNGGGSTRLGTVPLFASQYDWYGRSLFARFAYRF